MASENDENWFELSDPSDFNNSDKDDDDPADCDTQSTCSDSVLSNNADVAATDSNTGGSEQSTMKNTHSMKSTVSTQTQTPQLHSPEKQICQFEGEHARVYNLQQQIFNIRSQRGIRSCAMTGLPIDWHSARVDFNDRYQFVYMLGKRFASRLFEVDLLDVLIHTIANGNIKKSEETMWLRWCSEDASSFVIFLKQRICVTNQHLQQNTNPGIFSSAYGMCCVIH